MVPGWLGPSDRRTARISSRRDAPNASHLAEEGWEEKVELFAGECQYVLRSEVWKTPELRATRRFRLRDSRPDRGYCKKRGRDPIAREDVGAEHSATVSYICVAQASPKNRLQKVSFYDAPPYGWAGDLVDGNSPALVLLAI